MSGIDPVKRLNIKPQAIQDVQSTLKDNGIEGKILYVSDEIVDHLYGETVQSQIKEVGKLKTVIVKENTIAYAMRVAERVIATDVDCIVALGGGRVLDVCKYASYISKVPVLSIPTTAANDGMVSPIAVLKRNDGIPKSLGCAMPSMIVVDTDIIARGPIAHIRAGIGDTISNYMALKDWDFAVLRGKDRMNGYASLMSQTSLDALMKTQYHCICDKFISVLVNCLVMSGIAMDFAGSSRPVSGSEHLFSHALDTYAPKKNLHGFQVALGTVAVLRMLGLDSAEVENYLNKFQVIINPLSLEIDADTFVHCMQKSIDMRKDRYTHLHETDLSREKLTNIYEELVEELPR